jgi:hypothetical protein
LFTPGYAAEAGSVRETGLFRARKGLSEGHLCRRGRNTGETSGSWTGNPG